MKRNLIILATLSALIFTGCKNKDTNQEQTPEPQGEIVEDLTPDFQVDAEICETLGTIEDKSAYKIKLNYTDKYFKYSASTFRKDLMLLSFGATNSMVQKESGQKFFSGIGFTSLYASPEFDSLGTEDSAQYIIAKKKIDDFTVFAVSLKGNKYGLEWANNFNWSDTVIKTLEAARKI